MEVLENGEKQGHVELENLINDQVIKGNHVPDNVVLQEKLEGPVSLTKQLEHMGSIPNIPWDLEHNITYRKSRHLTTAATKAGSEPPSSIRGRIIYFVMQCETENSIGNTRVALHYDESLTALLNWLGISDTKRRATKKRVMNKPVHRIRTIPAITPDATLHGEASNNTDLDPTAHPMLENTDDTPVSNYFKTFTRQLVLNRGCAWRHHANELDSLVLNDYDIDTAVIKLNSFVKVDVHRINKGIVCTCDMYQMLANQPQDVTCMHVTFLKQHFLPHYEEIRNRPVINVAKMFHNAFTSRDSPVISLSKLSATTQKYSVKAITESTHEFVHITENGKFIACQSGQCRIKHGIASRRASKTLLHLNNATTVCPHLAVMLEHHHLWDHICIDATTEKQLEVIENMHVPGILAMFSLFKILFTIYLSIYLSI